MAGENLFLVFSSLFEKANLQYMVTGSVASTLYGEPRLTHDVDLVVLLESKSQVEALAKVFPQEQFYCPPIESMVTEMQREGRGHFNLIHHETGFKADVYPLTQDSLHQWAFGKRKEIRLQ